MTNKWVSSDWHLFHEGSLNNPKRNMFKSVEGMNDFILESFFSRVRRGDDFYFLGDIGWKFPSNYLEDLFLKIKKRGIKFHWVYGNHDRRYRNKKYPSVVNIGDLLEVKHKDYIFVLSHYPMIVWNRSHYNSINLHGHIHYKDSTWNKMQKVEFPEARRLNVNCELHDFKPLNFDNIIDKVEGINNFDLIERRQER